jgi:hypothetical protein
MFSAKSGMRWGQDSISDGFHSKGRTSGCWRVIFPLPCRPSWIFEECRQVGLTTFLMNPTLGVSSLRNEGAEGGSISKRENYG